MMELCVLPLLLMSSLHYVQTQAVSVSIRPSRSQFFKYERFAVSCEGEEASVATVMRMTRDGEVVSSGSTCSVAAAFPTTDSGEYWCETPLGRSNHTLNITVSASSVVLESPPLPVTQGDPVTLRCRVRSGASGGGFDFLKDGSLVVRKRTENMTIPHAAPSHQGRYKCRAFESEESAESWLIVEDVKLGVSAAAPPPAQQASPFLQYVLMLRHLLVGVPYMLSTIVLGLICIGRSRGRQRGAAPASDLIMETST